MISVIVPVLDDAAAAGRLLRTIPLDPYVEIILADGSADVELERLAASRADVRLLRTVPGRGHQMNAAAGHARGDWLLFVHADSQLPAGGLAAIRALESNPSIIGGWFRFRLDAAAWQARVIERLVAVRVSLLQLPYGDQGIFVRRHVFTEMGGYRPLPLMEDVEFVRRLTRGGRVAPLPLTLTTSARRWERDGWFRRSARNLILLGLYLLGVPPRRLVDWYRR